MSRPKKLAGPTLESWAPEYDEQGFPVLRAEPFGQTQFRVWCPDCRTYHYHGAMEGHRVAHCTKPDGAFKRAGYVLKLTNENE